ncbi:ABC transporter ATP-binding protein [Streptomyces clavuligerus]|uniref:ABC transporter related protein n=1 Tax=Streptomyces clavuligerus TaxID=1901 RepID=E2Q6Q4_STRCL|nr:ABC transporter ATP-binding protein [Streptomyces clavuligerus]ANW18066.1 ATP-binding protein [Streptomyces clavuligerus]AXU12625.1 ABC transporter ATP-binding protein [Streptomyces clavuligerus]EFG09353.1 ABC transporter related protein [Streptomyces clavuligerus]MBY6302527.1 ABC transporter ATP-binding protein [Streptomyces clavuligerus]QCS05406.1 ABC transporter ATP-binding protein [Streptomyces clavuligerus]
MSADQRYAYEVEDLHKRYGDSTEPANAGLSFRIEEGEFFGLLGSNGAGKTTLIKQMIGLVRPDRGSIRLFGHDVFAHSRYTTTHVGYMPQTAFALNSLTVREAVYFSAHLRGMSIRAAKRERDTLLEALGLTALARKVVRQLSGGERRLLQLAVTLTGAPPVLILDEPTNELDPSRRRQVWDLLRDLHQRDGRTVILITHNAIEAEQVIERVGIMREGELVALGAPAELKSSLRSRVRLTITLGEGDVLPDYLRIQSEHRGRVVALVDSADLPRLTKDVDLTRFPEFTIHTATLEDVYVTYA